MVAVAAQVGDVGGIAFSKRVVGLEVVSCQEVVCDVAGQYGGGEFPHRVADGGGEGYLCLCCRQVYDTCSGDDAFVRRCPYHWCATSCFRQHDVRCDSLRYCYHACGKQLLHLVHLVLVECSAPCPDVAFDVTVGNS